jgi:hypothetical protein
VSSYIAGGFLFVLDVVYGLESGGGIWFRSWLSLVWFFQRGRSWSGSFRFPGYLYFKFRFGIGCRQCWGTGQCPFWVAQLHGKLKKEKLRTRVTQVISDIEWFTHM